MKIDPHVHDLMQAYFEGDSSPETLAAIEAWLKQDPANLRIFAEYGCIEDMLYGEQQSMDAHAIHTMIAECDADPDWIAQLEQANQQKNQVNGSIDKDAITAGQLFSLTGYVLGLALTSKPAYRFYAAAAILLIVSIAALVMWPGDEAPPLADANPGPPAQTNTEPGPVGPVDQRVVATLTDQRDAHWHTASGDTAPEIGTALTAGQRLELTAGFVEITTQRGAVAILQAPAAIEFTNHDNAIRLHTGKLLGICETESSKGFLVYTHHMQITDLGTRFGVQTNADATEVHVFEGEVQAVRQDAARDTQPTRLTAEQSARTWVDTDSIERIDYTDNAFAAMLPRTIQLPGTGVGLTADSQVDPNWKVIAINGEPLDQPAAVFFSTITTYSRHIANDPATSQFIIYNPSERTPAGGFITYTFQTALTLPDDLDPADTRLNARYIADNELAAVIVNGHRTAIQDPLPLAYDRWFEFTITEHLLPGENTIAFEIRNLAPETSTNAGPVGLRLEWELTARPPLFDGRQ